MRVKYVADSDTKIKYNPDNRLNVPYIFTFYDVTEV